MLHLLRPSHQSACGKPGEESAISRARGGDMATVLRQGELAPSPLNGNALLNRGRFLRLKVTLQQLNQTAGWSARTIRDLIQGEDLDSLLSKHQ